MKNFFSILLLSAMFSFAANAQICTIDETLTEPGLYPDPDSIPCIVKGDFTDITVQFVNFDSADYQGIRIKVDYLIIDSITNLPCGIRWTTSAQNAATPHRFENQENGCIRFLGTTSDDAGQYELEVYVRAKISLAPSPIPVTASSVGLKVWVRVSDLATDPCPVIDTTASPASARVATCTTLDTLVGITDISSINYFSFYPNPTANAATVSFTADRAAVYTSRIVNIYGQEVSREVLNVTAGVNVNSIDVSNLAAGVYIYTITDGKNVQTQRFVVEK